MKALPDCIVHPTEKLIYYITKIGEIEGELWPHHVPYPLAGHKPSGDCPCNPTLVTMFDVMDVYVLHKPFIKKEAATE